jgi:isocitrate lyase
MASSIEVTERQKKHLCDLLRLKKDNSGIVINGLQRMIEDAVAAMSQEDVAWVEKITGVKAID